MIDVDRNSADDMFSVKARGLLIPSMTSTPPSIEMQTMLELNRLDEFFPSWKSIEIFGAHGAGKTFFCRQLKRPCLAISYRTVIRRLVDTRMSKTTKLIARLAPPHLMKNYYKSHNDRLSRRFWATSDANLRCYIDSVEQAISHALLPPFDEKKFRKHVRDTGLAIALSNTHQQKILVDEGLVRKLIVLIAKSKAGGEPSALLDLVRTCLTTYPWQKNAIFLDVPRSVSIERMVARGDRIQRPDRRYPDQWAAAERVNELCSEAGWKTLRVSNAINLTSAFG